MYLFFHSPRTPLILVSLAFFFSLFFNGYRIDFYSLSLLSCLGWAVLTLIQTYRKNNTIFLTPLAISMLLFLVWLGVSVFFSPVTYLAKMNFWWIGIISIVFFIYSLNPFTEKQWSALLLFILLVTVIIGIYALSQKHVYNLEPRAVFPNKNSLAALINLITFAVIWLYYKSAEYTRKYIPYVFLFIIFINIYLLGIIHSRAVLLGFVIAALLFFLATRKSTNKKLRNQLILTIVSALIVSFLSSRYLLQDYSDFIVRFAELDNPVETSLARLVIWQPAYELFKSSPYTGIGLGTFFLALPSVQNIKDLSAGYYVHNDYLQIATETGLPGLIFLLFICFSIIFTYIKSIKIKHINSSAFIEITALFCGLFTMAFHSFFSFNLYVMPLTIISGLFIARFYQIYLTYTTIKIQFPFSFSRYLRPAIFYTSITALFTILVVYFTTFWLASNANSSAIKAAQSGELQRAHKYYIRAQALNPDIDGYFYADANLLIQSAQLQKPSADRNIMLDIARTKLEKADTLNPYRPHIPYLWAQYHEAIAIDPGTDTDTIDDKTLIDLYVESLRRNPRYIPARIALANKYLHIKQLNNAYLTLTPGLGYAYRSLSPELLDYVYLMEKTAREYGNSKLAELMSAKHAEFRAVYEQLKHEDTSIPIQTY